MLICYGQVLHWDKCSKVENVLVVMNRKISAFRDCFSNFRGDLNMPCGQGKFGKHMYVVPC